MSALCALYLSTDGGCSENLVQYAKFPEKQNVLPNCSSTVPAKSF